MPGGGFLLPFSWQLSSPLLFSFTTTNPLSKADPSSLAQTPSRTAINKNSFDLSFGNPEARVLVGNIMAPVYLSLPEALKDGCGHLCFNSKLLIWPVSLSFLALLVPVAQRGR